MINHVCVVVSSEENARQIFEKILKMPMLYSFEIDTETTNALFQVEIPVKAMVFDAGNCRVEVFSANLISDDRHFNHICLNVTQRKEIIRQAELSGLEIRRHKRPDGNEVVFMIDTDGNIFELKGT